MYLGGMGGKLESDPSANRRQTSHDLSINGCVEQDVQCIVAWQPRSRCCTNRQIEDTSRSGFMHEHHASTAAMSVNALCSRCALDQAH